MAQVGGPETERKIISILRILSESSEPLGSITIARELTRYGIFLSERAVRYHLRIADERGYTQALGRDGRTITPGGLDELKKALAPEQVGFVLARLELLAFRTTFNPRTKSGQIPINTSIIDKNRFQDAVNAMKEAFKNGLCASELIATAAPGEKLGSVVVPEGKVGLGTVCSVVVNGILLKAGIPIESKFGGVLELQDSRPRRFTAIINYSGTSIDPSEQYIRAGMTSVREAAIAGNGSILANFREIPAPARSLVAEYVEIMKESGVNPVYVLGNTSEALCQIPVGLNRVGMVLLGGLNPVSAACEAGIPIQNIGESGLLDFRQLHSYKDL